MNKMIFIVALFFCVSGFTATVNCFGEDPKTGPKHNITIETVTGVSDVLIDNAIKGKTPFKTALEAGRHAVRLSRKDFPDLDTYIEVAGQKSYVFRQTQTKAFGKQLGVFKCGRMPKQVIFTPDDKYLYIILLDGIGFQIFDMEKLEMHSYVDVKQHTGKASFVEGLFLPDYKKFLVSQMTTAMIAEFDVSDTANPAYLRKFSSEGTWPKYFTYSKPLNLIAASNWLSHDVSIINYTTGKVERKLGKFRMPRGVVFTADGKYLYITSFDSGLFLKYDTATWKEVKRYFRKGAAMRHVVLSSDEKRCYVSNMFHSEIYEFDADTLKILKTYKVFDNPNTIELSSDDRYLFVSCRGPNNPKSYLMRSPKDGKTYIIDVLKQELTAVIDGGNQPTGLDISGNGKYLAFSNFRDDNNIDIYDISELNIGASAGK
jgi:DNA-binding beta-propeller fold protein YncE